jgi:hypothetical protein
MTRLTTEIRRHLEAQVRSVQEVGYIVVRAHRSACTITTQAQSTEESTWTVNTVAEHTRYVRIMEHFEKTLKVSESCSEV